MVRDSIKDKKYFEEFIDYQNTRIKKFTDILNTLKTNKSDENKVIQCTIILAIFIKDKIVAMYSYGYSKDDIKTEFDKYIEYLLVTGIASYNEMVDFLSLAILLDCTAEQVEKFMSIKQFDDSLVLMLKNYLMEKKIVKFDAQLEYETDSEIFVQYLNSDCEEKEVLEYIENNWYESNSEAPWYDSHNNNNDIYVGYWCWVGAAVLKIKEVSLIVADCKYLPSDLL